MWNRRTKDSMIRDFVFDAKAPDAGYWQYDGVKSAWVESDASNLYQQNSLVRKKNKDTTHGFFVDGFPRQANHTLRQLLLACFLNISIEIAGRTPSLKPKSPRKVIKRVL